MFTFGLNVSPGPSGGTVVAFVKDTVNFSLPSFAVSLMI